MDLTRQILTLLRKDLLLEFRKSYAISGILLYVFSTVFIVYTSFVEIPATIWNTLFWIIILFAAVNAIVKSFVQENGQRQLYYYSLVNPVAVLLAKMIYNILLLLVITLLCWGAFSFIAGNRVVDTGLFFLALFLGSLGFSITFTFVAAIAAKADGNATLMAILSFPLVIPIIMTLVKMSGNALTVEDTLPVQGDIMILTAIDLLLLGVGLVLFPFLWRD